MVKTRYRALFSLLKKVGKKEAAPILLSSDGMVWGPASHPKPAVVLFRLRLWQKKKNQNENRCEWLQLLARFTGYYFPFGR